MLKRFVVSCIIAILLVVLLYLCSDYIVAQIWSAQDNGNCLFGDYTIVTTQTEDIPEEIKD